MHGLAARMTVTGWLTMYLLIIALPVALTWAVGREPSDGIVEILATDTGLIAFSLLVVSLVLMARMPSLMAAVGIEMILLMHRMVALSVVVLVAVHVVLIVVSDPRGIGIFDLRVAPPPTWAAYIATALLGATVWSGMRRRRRQPRYEGWRMLHIALAGTVFVSAWLHVWWLNLLTAHAVHTIWFVSLGVVVLAVAVRRWLWLPLRAHRRSYVVDEVAPVQGDAVTLKVNAHGHGGFPFRAGQFAWLKIGSSSFVFEEHPFTIASTAEEPHRKEFTIKALGDFSELLRGLRPGRRVFLDGPYGRFTMDGLAKSDGFVFIAGGVGLTPMISMMRTLADRSDSRHHRLLIGARSLDDLMLRDEIDQLRGQLNLTVTQVIEAPPPGWDGESGRMDAELLDKYLPHASRHHEYFLCGPPPMVIAVGQQLRERGIATKHIHTERFEVV